MSVESAFTSLRHALQVLQEAATALQVTITEDVPKQGATVLVDLLDNHITELVATLEEAAMLVAQASRYAKSATQLDQSRSTLADAHALLNRAVTHFSYNISSHAQITQLLEMGRERGREWRAWSGEVQTAIDRCSQPKASIADALLECWNELAQRLGQSSVSLQTTNIGQQISVREDQLELISHAN